MSGLPSSFIIFEFEKLSKGNVALVSDAGTPAINDPGYELVKIALASGFDVQPVPGVYPGTWDALGGARLLDVNNVRGGPPGIVLWP